MDPTASELPSSIALSKYSRVRRKLGVTPSPVKYILPTERTDGGGVVLRRGLLEPCPRLLEVYIDRP